MRQRPEKTRFGELDRIGPAVVLTVAGTDLCKSHEEVAALHADPVVEELLELLQEHFADTHHVACSLSFTKTHHARKCCHGREVRARVIEAAATAALNVVVYPTMPMDPALTNLLVGRVLSFSTEVPTLHCDPNQLIRLKTTPCYEGRIVSFRSDDADGLVGLVAGELADPMRAVQISANSTFRRRQPYLDAITRVNPSFVAFVNRVCGRFMSIHELAQESHVSTSTLVLFERYPMGVLTLPGESWRAMRRAYRMPDVDALEALNRIFPFDDMRRYGLRGRGGADDAELLRSLYNFWLELRKKNLYLLDEDLLEAAESMLGEISRHSQFIPVYEFDETLKHLLGRKPQFLPFDLFWNP